MRGFLRRTLASARGAEPRLKPLTGSVYASHHRWQEFPSGSWGEDTVNALPGAGAVPPSRPLSQPGIPQATSISAPAPLLPVRHDPPEAAAGGDESNSERQPTSSAAPPDRESVIRPASHSGALQAPISLPASLATGNLPLLSDSLRNEGSRTAATVLQVPQERSRVPKHQQSEEPRLAASARPQKVEPLLRSVVSAIPPRAAPQLSRPQNRPPHEPEIQVHIGRIEVIAAAPQTPRVPSPRPNRATSLADYLAGRNGRSR